MNVITTNSATQSVVFHAEPVAAAFYDFDDAGKKMATAKQIILAAFPKGITFEQFEGRRKMVVDALVSSGKSANHDSASKMFNRVRDDAGIEKPKAASKKAEDQAKRDAEKREKLAELVNKPMPELVKLAESGNLLAADAMKARAREQQKEQAEKVKTIRKATKEQIDNAAPEVIETVSAMVPQAAAFAKIMGALRLLAKDLNCATFDEKVIDAACERIIGKAKRQVVKRAA